MTDEIRQTLEWIGVTDSTHIANIRENFTTFDELSQITASNISNLVDDFRRRTLTAGKYSMPSWQVFYAVDYSEALEIHNQLALRI